MIKNRYFTLSICIVLVQYYDYHLYGFLAARIANYFFPSGEMISRLLSAYLVMSISMFAKPLGAVILGSIGDKIGRTMSVKISLLCTAISSLVIFITPSYEVIGSLSTVILFIARMLISASVSAGSDGVRLFVYENIGENRRSLGIGITTFFTLSGSLLAAFSAYYFTVNSNEISWRYSFLIGSIAGFILLIFIYLSNYVDLIAKKTDDVDISYKALISNNLSLIIYCSLLAGSIGSMNQFMVIFWNTYNASLLQTISQSAGKLYTAYFLIIYMLTTLVSGAVSDKINKLNMIILSSILMLILCAMQSYYIYRGSYQNSTLIYLSFSVFLPCVIVPALAIFKDSLVTQIRYRIFSLSHAVGSILISAPTAYSCTLLYKYTNISFIPIGYFSLTICFVLLSTIKLSARQGKNKSY